LRPMPLTIVQLRSIRFVLGLAVCASACASGPPPELVPEAPVSAAPAEPPVPPVEDPGLDVLRALVAELERRGGVPGAPAPAEPEPPAKAHVVKKSGKKVGARAPASAEEQELAELRRLRELSRVEEDAGRAAEDR